MKDLECILQHLGTSFLPHAYQYRLFHAKKYGEDYPLTPDSSLIEIPSDDSEFFNIKTAMDPKILFKDWKLFP